VRLDHKIVLSTHSNNKGLAESNAIVRERQQRILRNMHNQTRIKSLTDELRGLRGGEQNEQLISDTEVEAGRKSNIVKVDEYLNEL
jgi:hypothetical protein